MAIAPPPDLRAAVAIPVDRGSADRTLAAARAQPAVRDRGIDALKGVGIALVVLGHAFIGLMAARLAPADGWMAWAHYTVYLFHMPLFFVLSGLFVARRLDDAPPAFLAWLGRRLVWPYLLWSTLQLAVIHAAGAAVNTPAALSAWRLVELLWAPASQYWFLHALALFHLLAYASGRLGGQAAWLPAAALLLLGFVLSGGGWPAVGFYVPFLLWYAAGATLGSGRFSAWLQAAGGQTLVLAAPLLALALLLAQVPGLRAHEVAHQAPQTLGAQLAGVAMVLLAVARAGTSTQRLLAWLGRRSMAIFLMHVMAVAGCRVAMMRLPVAVPAEAILVVSVAMGLLLPCLVQWAAQRVGVATWLGLDRG
ncbi:acyltransferase family protein [Ideonella sp. A 288]|uniref:acyltransferase family protein n=1 Tax=Ideonella sp. A 288 TaxID=1962181 RepID=UPI0011856678|nr:acyltransferase [Ideonella sp. A 288]